MDFFIISALDLDQYYMKVRIRRAQAYEAEEKLEEAFEGKFILDCLKYLGLHIHILKK